PSSQRFMALTSTLKSRGEVHLLRIAPLTSPVRVYSLTVVAAQTSGADPSYFPAAALAPGGPGQCGASRRLRRLGLTVVRRRGRGHAHLGIGGIEAGLLTHEHNEGDAPRASRSSVLLYVIGEGNVSAWPARGAPFGGC